MAFINAAKVEWPEVATARPEELNKIFKFPQVRLRKTAARLDSCTQRARRLAGLRRAAFGDGEMSA